MGGNMAGQEQSWVLARNTNQARGIAEYAKAFVGGRGTPSAAVFARLEQFHIDSVACGLAALGEGANAPWVLRHEARDYPQNGGALCLGDAVPVALEKAIVANVAAVRELDSNGTNFGFNPKRRATRGEFGHNDFYPVVWAGAAAKGHDGKTALTAMLCLDEIRGRLAEVFPLRNYKIDHVVHGAIGSAAVLGALLGASVDQIESAIGMTVAHYIPFRAIRAGHQLSDSKGASAAISTEAAALSVLRSMRGFIGPKDIFRNAQAIFRLFEPTKDHDKSPFDLEMGMSGDDFAIMSMHFKLGLYEHQSAGAIGGAIDLLKKHPAILETPEALERVTITIYEPAFGIIGDPAKRNPETRQSADHSMIYIIATLLRKAFEKRVTSWEDLMLLPEDYDDKALWNSLTRSIMQRIEFKHGGAEYDAKYPEGIPTTVEVSHKTIGTVSSGLVMFPMGHALCKEAGLAKLLDLKFRRLAAQGVDDVEDVRNRFSNLAAKSTAEFREMLKFPLKTGAAH
jgi:2-methylcitrate dehydratase